MHFSLMQLFRELAEECNVLKNFIASRLSDSDSGTSRRGPGRTTDICIGCSADACLCGLFRGRGGQQLYTMRCKFML